VHSVIVGMASADSCRDQAAGASRR
jgi:hypothetical protein